MKEKKGLLVLISGPSGVGKKTLWSRFIDDKELNLSWSVSMTTRKPRLGEINGKDYFFVSKERFENAIQNHELLEYATYVDQYYGTPNAYVNQMRSLGKNVFLEIEPKGALQVINYFKKNNDPKIITIFIVPPNFVSLKKRLVNRQTESKELIKKRIANAKKELKMKNYYDFVVVNDDIERASSHLHEVIKTAIIKNGTNN